MSSNPTGGVQNKIKQPFHGLGLGEGALGMPLQRKAISLSAFIGFVGALVIIQRKHKNREGAPRMSPRGEHGLATSRRKSGAGSQRDEESLMGLAHGIAVLHASDADEIERRLRAKLVPGSAVEILAMYSSLLDAVVTDPAHMTTPISDHLVHRGHGVFDTCTLRHNRLHCTDEHIDRLLQSAAAARIHHGFTRASILRAILAAAKASGASSASVRYWIGAGPGDFHWLPDRCVEATLYVVVYNEKPSARKLEPSFDAGLEEITVTPKVPFKPPLLAGLKSNNYLINCLSGMESYAASKRGCYGIQVDEKGRVGEGAVCSALFVFEQEASSNGASNGTSPDEEVRHLVVATPRFDGTILAGTTAAAALALLNEASMLGASAFDQYLRPGETRVVVVDARQRDVYAAEAKEKAREMIFVAGDYKVHGVVRWDGTAIGQGSVGPVARYLNHALEARMHQGNGVAV
ncbi:D-amino-acid transaminase [Pycnococcus provasolii]